MQKSPSQPCLHLTELHNASEESLGVVYTPPELVAFMVHLARPIKARCRVLEPACANAPFLEAFANRYGTHHELVGVEIEPKRLARARERLPTMTFVEADFLLWEPKETFDVVIGNPPYGIIGDASHYPLHALRERKALYRQRSLTWRGKYNIYGAFIEQATRLLAPEGKLVFVVPASWLVLDDFVRLREHLATQGRLSVYYLGKVFPKRNVSVVVLVLEKGGRGLALYDGERLAVEKLTYNGEMIRFETAELLQMEREGVAVGELFTICFAARSPEVHRHPAVRTEPAPGYVPVLTGRNLHAGRIDYETCYSGYWMAHARAAELRAFYAFPHLVVAHTKGTRVVCALDERCYPWREEFHLIPIVEYDFVKTANKANPPILCTRSPLTKRGAGKGEGEFNTASAMQAVIANGCGAVRAISKLSWTDLLGVMEWLNSAPVQWYVQSLYRDFVPHLTRAMLARVPVPPTYCSPRT